MSQPLDGRSDAVVMSDQDVARALKRLAHEIVERNHGTDQLILLGIPTRGAPLAARLAALLAEIDPDFDPAHRLGQLDVTMYRDDLRRTQTRTLEPTVLPPGGIEGAVVVLVDDVLYSGRTIRAALDALGDHGRPQAIQLAVLIDRGHRELPIRADYVGKNLPTARHERVQVHLAETDGCDAVVIARGPDGAGDVAELAGVPKAPEVPGVAGVTGMTEVAGA